MFAYGIVELNLRQEKELNRNYEEPLLVKLGLSRNFPQSVLCSSKSALGIRIMTSTIIIEILKAKLFLGNVRVGGNTAKALAVQEEYLALEAGREITIDCKPSERCWKPTWINEVSDIFNKRNIKITTENARVLTYNKTIMAHAIDCAKEKGLAEKELKHFNFSWNEWQNYKKST